MIDYIFIIGVIGSLILITGAAYPESKDMNKPMKSVKNWLLTLGAIIMFSYAYLGYLNGTTIFFLILQIFALLASAMMMANTSDKVDIIVMSLGGLGLIVWSLTLFDGYNTVIFILGFVGIGLGYTLQMGTVRRHTSLVVGSILIAIFSYLEASWIFFWLNIFFAMFASYYVVKLIRSGN